MFVCMFVCMYVHGVLKVGEGKLQQVLCRFFELRIQKRTNYHSANGLRGMVMAKVCCSGLGYLLHAYLHIQYVCTYVRMYVPRCTYV